jgi:3-deoxy-manno-octulosonate cytidylyltransferase (CMP-KDO synthetase)
MRPIAIIPARWASTRFPGKPLALLAGRPLVLHVLEACRRSGAFSEVIVATDDARIAAAVTGAGGRAERTSSDHPSGTDRVAEVSARLQGGDSDVVVNVQGDEPLVHPESLRALVAAFEDSSVEMATLIRPLDEAERHRPVVVKAVLDVRGDALYFSRADIPCSRDGTPVERWAHLGLYGYRRATLARLSQLPPTPLERAEALEQLRALEHGIRIRCVRTTFRSVGVDTPEDLARAEAFLSTREPSPRTPGGR